MRDRVLAALPGGDAPITVFVIIEEPQHRVRRGGAVTGFKVPQQRRQPLQDDPPGPRVRQGRKAHRLHLPGIALDRVAQLDIRHRVQPDIAEGFGATMKPRDIDCRPRAFQRRAQRPQLRLAPVAGRAGDGMGFQKTAKGEDLRDPLR